MLITTLIALQEDPERHGYASRPESCNAISAANQHYISRQQHERGCDLRDRKGPLATAGAAGDADAAAGEVHAIGGIGRRQARHKRQNHRGDYGQRHSHPEHAPIDC